MTRQIADELRRSIEGQPWHGPSVMTNLVDVTAAEAHRKPIADAHSIAELVAHVTAWIAAADRLLRGEVGELTGDADWPVPGHTPEDWQQLVARLREAITTLAARVEQMSDDDLRVKVRTFGHEYPRWFLLHGVAQHNAYHGGQMAMLKKALRSPVAPHESQPIAPAL